MTNVLKRLTNDLKYSLKFQFFSIFLKTKVNGKQNFKLQWAKILFFTNSVDFHRNWANNYSKLKTMILGVHISGSHIYHWFYEYLVGLVRSMISLLKYKPQIIQNDVAFNIERFRCIHIPIDREEREKNTVTTETMQLTWFIPNHRKWTHMVCM